MMSAYLTNDEGPGDRVASSLGWATSTGGWTSWARALFKEAARTQAEAAATAGARAVKRVELLRLRFQEGMPIRDIAVKWDEDAAKLHREFATARDEFRAALRRVLAFHLPTATAAQLDTAGRELLALLTG